MNMHRQRTFQIVGTRFLGILRRGFRSPCPYRNKPLFSRSLGPFGVSRRSIHLNGRLQNWNFGTEVLLAMCVLAYAQSGPLDGDSANDGTAPPETKWETHTFARSEATSGTADPSPALGHSGLAAGTLNGHGPGCTPLSPCAAVSPARRRPVASGEAATHRMRPHIMVIKAGDPNLPALTATAGVQNVARAGRDSGK